MKNRSRDRVSANNKNYILMAKYVLEVITYTFDVN